MKLGSQTGSVINHLHSRAVIGQPKPEVGMGATLLGWTDRHAATITAVTECCGKTWQYEIEVANDDAKVVKGSTFDGTAEYEYTPGTGCDHLFAFHLKKQEWIRVIRNPVTNKLNQARGYGLRIGERETYYDPSF